jgi:hypothetical protein
MNQNKLAIIFCPPQSLFPVQPSDISKAMLVDCPTCDKPMWLSKMKKKKMQEFSKLGADIIFECYLCFEETVKETPELLKNVEMVNI